MTVASPVWTERWFHAMGAEVHLLVADGPDDAIAAVPQRLEELEQCWSRFRASSDLSRLNDDERERVEVSPMLVAALDRALIAARLTDGRFDPTVHDALCRAGYATSFASSPTRRGDLASCRPSPGVAAVRIDVERCIVERPRGLRFDLGGIGKGLAADIVATALVDAGATGVCLAMGGDVRVAGTAPGDGWKVPVEDPRRAGADRVGDVWFEATMTEGAIVTSTTQFRRWTTVDGARAHHLIDPATGRPAESGVAAVVVAASEAWWAEVLAKAAVVAGPVDGPRLLERHGVTGWSVSSDDVEAAA